MTLSQVQSRVLRQIGVLDEPEPALPPFTVPPRREVAAMQEKYATYKTLRLNRAGWRIPRTVKCICGCEGVWTGGCADAAANLGVRRSWLLNRLRSDRMARVRGHRLVWEWEQEDAV